MNTRLFQLLAVLCILLLPATAHPAAAANVSGPVVPERYFGLIAGLDAGSYHTCAMIGFSTGTPGANLGGDPIQPRAGKIMCWGFNEQGQLGDGTNDTQRSPVDVPGLTDVMALTAGGFHTCALAASTESPNDVRVKCWGLNEYGQLGDGTKSNRSSPVDVPGLTGVISLTAGDHFTCALTAGGEVKCWGSNWFGQLGDGTTTDRSSPVDVPGLTGVVALSAGAYHTCALTDTGPVKCWGFNAQGQLGDGTTANRSYPVEVTGVTEVAYLTSGSFHTCALTTSGGVKCWGWNSYGQLGNSTTADSSSPEDVIGLIGVRALEAGSAHNCAVTASGGVRCWGNNSHGQLGDGTTSNSSSPLDVPGLAGAVGLTGGSYHTCVVTGPAGGSGGVKCWGLNLMGQLGEGTMFRSLVPVYAIHTGYAFIPIAIR